MCFFISTAAVKKAELIVGDETGETKLIAWRNLTEILEGIKPGERLILKGVSSQLGRDESPFLLIRQYSSIENIK